MSRSGVRGGHLGFQSRDLEEMVIHDVMGDLILPQGRYPEKFILISLLEVCKEGGVKKGVSWRMLRVDDWKHRL